MHAAAHEGYGGTAPHLYRMVVNEMMFSVPARFANGCDLG